VERTPEAFRNAFRWCREHAELVRAAGRKNSALIQETRSWNRVKGAWRRAWCEALQCCEAAARPPLAAEAKNDALAHINAKFYSGPRHIITDSREATV
jgi:hypothetical protein